MFQEKQHPLTLKQSPLVAVEIWYQGGCMGRSNGGLGQSFSYLLPRPWLFRDLKDVVIIVSRPPKVPSTKERSFTFAALISHSFDRKRQMTQSCWYVCVRCFEVQSQIINFLHLICWASSVSFGWILAFGLLETCFLDLHVISISVAGCFSLTTEASGGGTFAPATVAVNHRYQSLKCITCLVLIF